VLLLWWSLWLLASWIMAFGWRWEITPAMATYMTASKRMMLSVMLGITIIWPLYRLVMRPAHTPRLLPLQDWVAIFATLQMLLWPVRVPTQWSAIEVLLIDITIFAWGLLYAALIAMGAGRRRRSAVMIVCVLVAAAGPFIALVSGTFQSAAQSGWLYWSPVSGPWMLIGRTSIHIEPASWLRIGVVGGAAVLAWVGIMLLPIEPLPDNGSPSGRIGARKARTPVL